MVVVALVLDYTSDSKEFRPVTYIYVPTFSCKFQPTIYFKQMVWAFGILSVSFQRLKHEQFGKDFKHL